MERIVAESEIDWTVVVPPKLTNGPRTGQYRVAITEDVTNSWSISRADVADYFVTHLTPPPLASPPAYVATGGFGEAETRWIARSAIH